MSHTAATTSSPEQIPSLLKAHDTGLVIELDPGSALPAGLGEDEQSVPLSLELELELGGEEVRGPVGGIEYEGTERLRLSEPIPGSFAHMTEGGRETFSWSLAAAGWQAKISVRVGVELPRAALSVALSPTDESPALLRNLWITAAPRPEDAQGWLVEAPGNTLRSGVEASELKEPIYVLTIGGEEGSPGIVGLHSPDEERGVLIWPFSRSESGRITLQPFEGSVAVEIETELAADLPQGEWIEWGPLYLDFFTEPWSQVLEGLRSCYRRLGVTTPDDRPRWSESLNILEAQVGMARFWDGWDYNPYPELKDLRADLDRIVDLGYQCIQLMPRQPYPGYTIHYPGEIDQTWGERGELREFVEECHRRGLKVILDVLCSCVADKSAFRESVEAIKSGPYGDRLDEPSIDAMSPIHVSEDIPTCRFVLDFAEDWIAGAPERHPLLDEHPEWFMRNSAGEVVGVFTHGLEIANQQWQDFFLSSCEDIVRELGIDGFRFDTPMYNRFHDWSEERRRHASYSCLASLQFYRRARERLHALDPELLIYIEPSSPLFREAVDLTYPYEEAWLIQSVFQTKPEDGREWRRVRNGRELSRWFGDFYAALPKGSVTAHHIDSHDTFWWPLPGQKWRREQVGIEVTKALLVIYGLRGGAYMTYVGGEQGIEPELRRLHRLRSDVEVLRVGEVDFAGVEVDDERVYSVLRSLGDERAVIAVNVDDQPLRCKASIALDDDNGQSGSEPALFDAWSEERLGAGRVEGGRLHIDLELAPYQARVILPDHAGIAPA